VKHKGTGKIVEKEDIPKWKGTPKGRGPFERTACGAHVTPGLVANTKRGVNCGACKRTRLYKESTDGQETTTRSG
jgi:hypothetical protein